MKYTVNYNFKKPEPLDTRNINDLNDSFDLVDSKLKSVEDSNKNLDATFKQLIINAGSSNAEIVSARRDNVTGVTYETLPKRLDTVTSQLSEIMIQNIQLAENEIATTKIQSALDKGGIVNVFVTNVAYIDATLQVGDNTELNILNGTLKEKAGTRNYMLTNKDYINGNENIKISGIFDVDGANNLPTGSYPAYPGHCIFMNNVRKINIHNIKVMNAKKYCFLIANCQDSEFSFIEFSSESDGLHFNPPCSNLKIYNLFGHTGDDMLSFTLGDYASYEVSNIGNYENIIVDGLIGNDAAALVKMTGSGKDSLYKLRNISIQNLFGTVTKNAIFITDDGVNLVNTTVEGINIKNVCVEGCTNPMFFITPTYGKDITIENVTATPTAILFEFRNTLDNITLRNIKNTIAMGSYFANVVGTINNLIIDNVDLLASDGNIFIKIASTAVINKLTMNNVNYRSADVTTGTGKFLVNSSTVALTTPMDVRMSNVTVGKHAYLFQADTSMVVRAVNCSFATYGTGVFVGNNATFRLVGNNNTYAQTLNPYLNTSGKCSINDLDVKTYYDKITPQQYDIFYNLKDGSTATPAVSIGAVVYNGTIYKNIY